MARETFHFAAPAKINLTLAVSAPLTPPHPRAGFHLIDSILVAIDFHDDLIITPDPESAPTPANFTISWADVPPLPPRRSPIDWPIEKDLAFRAWSLLQQSTDIPLNAHIHLRKRIPIGGGLGGGSSDAATLLLALRTLFKLPHTADQLRAIASQLGSDLPFFIDDDLSAPTASTLLSPRPARITGLGDSIERITLPPSNLLLIIPPMGCPTGPVYRAFDALLSPTHAFPHDPALITTLLSALAHPTAQHQPLPPLNDLLPAAEQVAPGLKTIREHMQAATGHTVHLSGSGSSLFILTPTPPTPQTQRAWLTHAHECGCTALWTRLLLPSPPS